LSCVTLLAHPYPSAPLALVTDASTSDIGDVLQQRVKNAWQPLTFSKKKLYPAQQKYSAYDRELLAIYETVKHFRHMLVSAPLHHLHLPQSHHLRLPAEAGQMLTAAV
jgi:cleavage and polyadenylation specificity factor subunit 1